MCSQAHCQLPQTCWRAGQTSCPIPSSPSLLAKAEKPITHKSSTFTAAVVTCTSAHQSHQAGVAWVRQIPLQPSVLKYPGRKQSQQSHYLRHQQDLDCLKEHRLNVYRSKALPNTKNVPSALGLRHEMLTSREGRKAEYSLPSIRDDQLVL